MEQTIEKGTTKKAWYSFLHFTKGQIIALLFFIILLPVALLFSFILWITIHQSDHFLGVGREEVLADQAGLEIYVSYDSNSEMEPSTYDANTQDAIVKILTDSGVGIGNIQVPYQSQIKVKGFTSENKFALLNQVITRIKNQFPRTQITVHYSYIVTPEAKTAALIKAIQSARDQSNSFATAEGKKVIYFKTSTCQTAVLDSTQTYNPSKCTDTPNTNAITDNSPTKNVIVTVDANTAFSF